MKKIATLSAILLISIAANAQGDFETFRDREFNFDFLHTTGVLIGIFLFTSFFLAIIRLFLDSRLKSKMIEKKVFLKLWWNNFFNQPTEIVKVLL